MEARRGGSGVSFAIIPRRVISTASPGCVPRYYDAVSPIELLHNEIRACRKCEADGFPISPPPLVGGGALADFLLIGQAPSLTDLREGRMYCGPAGRKLIGWLCQAGFTEEDLGKRIYLTALTKCFPGRLPGKSTDRAPSPKERANCRPWLDAQMALIQPKVIILFGKMAIHAFLPPLPLDQAVGRVFVQGGITYIPLPHSSGASTWLNSPEHQALLAEAIARLREERMKADSDCNFSGCEVSHSVKP